MGIHDKWDMTNPSNLSHNQLVSRKNRIISKLHDIDFQNRLKKKSGNVNQKLQIDIENINKWKELRFLEDKLLTSIINKSTQKINTNVYPQYMLKNLIKYKKSTKKSFHQAKRSAKKQITLQKLDQDSQNQVQEKQKNEFTVMPSPYQGNADIQKLFNSLAIVQDLPSDDEQLQGEQDSYVQQRSQDQLKQVDLNKNKNQQRQIMKRQNSFFQYQLEQDQLQIQKYILKGMIGRKIKCIH